MLTDRRCLSKLLEVHCSPATFTKKRTPHLFCSTCLSSSSSSSNSNSEDKVDEKDSITERFVRKEDSFLSPNDFILRSFELAEQRSDADINQNNTDANSDINNGAANDTATNDTEQKNTNTNRSPPKNPRLGLHLTRYGINLNKLAAEKELDKVIGRDKEINTAMQILCRRRKNNPCFIGEPGVGKVGLCFTPLIFLF